MLGDLVGFVLVSWSGITQCKICNLFGDVVMRRVAICTDSADGYHSWIVQDGSLDHGGGI